LNKDHNQEDFDWSFTKRKNDSLIPQIFFNEINPRMSPKDILMSQVIGDRFLSSDYLPRKENNMPAKIYSFVHNDSFYDHFLKNQIRFWAESL